MACSIVRRLFAKKAWCRSTQVPSTILVSNFPADQLPPEVVHMVSKFLERTEVASFRLLCRNVAQIRLEYLVPEVQFRCNENCYDRLLATAKHPVVSRYVTNLACESDNFMPLSFEQ